MHGVAGGAICEQVKLLFLDAILHLTARVIELFVKLPCIDGLLAQRGDHEPWVGPFVQELGFANDTPAT